ncbi:LysE family translocator [Motiliproteus coralliicola]|uniref:LysE family translocator n=1 Tax=Motiliproteus coralliicola TaxID=2283196 RepID=A0A369WQS7_9GAMM|nr:LysE family translocator [Motiliproteus coralliicola]RDE24052.1 LysE family translocator [Motiliproteus coralliicola]
MSFESWLAFSSIALIATLTPGPAILLVMTHSLRSGIGRACYAMAGNVSGLFLMSSCSVLGLSALVLHSSLAFTLIKTLGAAYLIYMGVKLWRHGIKLQPPAKITDSPSNQSGRQTAAGFNTYTQGLLVSLTNPKAIVFTTALFPQFIDIHSALLPQFSLLVGTFMLFSLLCLLGYALLAKRLLGGMAETTGQKLSRAFGGTFIGAGLTLAFSTQR